MINQLDPSPLTAKPVRTVISPLSKVPLSDIPGKQPGSTRHITAGVDDAEFAPRCSDSFVVSRSSRRELWCLQAEMWLEVRFGEKLGELGSVSGGLLQETTAAHDGVVLHAVTSFGINANNQLIELDR